MRLQRRLPLPPRPQVKQSPGWAVTQPRPGYHQWTTPSGRQYTKGPKEYPI